MRRTVPGPGRDLVGVIYADLEEAVPAEALFDFARIALGRAESDPGEETARAALIAAGVLEQAVADTPEAASRLLGPAMAVSDAAAALFLAPPGERAPLAGKAREQLGRAACPGGLKLRLRTPGGFAFDAVYPESYAGAAAEWARRHPPAGRCLVLGVRSGGTALSAVVAGTLRREGWDVERMTLPPCEFPFDRPPEIPGRKLEAVQWVWAVGEGARVSLGTVEAVAAACARGGVPQERMVLLAGPPPDALSGLPGRLAAESARIEGRPVHCTEEWSAGRWRAYCFAPERPRPFTCPVLERRKYRCVFAGGAAHLWKFAGLPGVPSQNALCDFHRLERSAAAGWTPQPLACREGFIALRWEEGRPAFGFSPGLASHAARYLMAGSEWLEGGEARRAHERLRPLMASNLGPALGPEIARRAMRLWERTRPVEAPLCHDPRLAPHEWIATPRGGWIKCDSTGHLHTAELPGRQPYEWGVAAVCNQGSREESAFFLRELARRNCRLAPARLLAYRLAEAACRLGVLELAQENAAEPERAAIRAERARVCGVVRWLLS